MGVAAIRYTEAPDGRSTTRFLSRASDELWGYTAEQVAKDPDVLWRAVHHEDLPFMRASVALSKSELTRWRHRFRITTAQQDLRWVEAIGSPVRLKNGDTEWITLLIDMTERELREQKHTAKLSTLERLLNQIPEGVVAMNRDFRYVFVNDSAAQFVGKRPSELIDRSFIEVFSDTASESWLLRLKQCIETEVPIQIEGQYGPTQSQFRARISPSQDGIVTIFNDITQEQEIKLARERVQALKAQSERAQALATLSTGIAHELNNLMAIIRGSLELIKIDSPLTEPSAKSLDRAARATTRAAEIIQSLRSYSTGVRESDRPQHMDLGAVVSQVVSSLKPSMPKAVAFSYDLPIAPIPVFVDRASLSQSLVSLILNAKDAALEADPNSSPTIGLRVGKASQGSTKRHMGNADAYAFVEVEDNGKGIRPEIQDRIFEPFFTTKMVGKGTGLGLSEVYGFAQRSQGFIEVSSMLDVGSKFTVYLPVAQSEINEPR